MVKRIKRRVIAIIPTNWDITKQHNPRGYWYILECNHVAFEFHRAKIHIDYGMFSNKLQIPLTKFCEKCGVEEKINKTFLKFLLGEMRANDLTDELITLYKTIKDE